MSRTQMPYSLKQLPVLLMMTSFRLQKTLADYRDDPPGVKGSDKHFYGPYSAAAGVYHYI